MKSIIICIWLLVSLASALNYQERRIFYNNQDHVCLYGNKGDQTILHLTIDGNITFTFDAAGESLCDRWAILEIDQIGPLGVWGYY